MLCSFLRAVRAAETVSVVGRSCGCRCLVQTVIRPRPNSVGILLSQVATVLPLNSRLPRCSGSQFTLTLCPVVYILENPHRASPQSARRRPSCKAESNQKHAKTSSRSKHWWGAWDPAPSFGVDCIEPTVLDSLPFPLFPTKMCLGAGHGSGLGRGKLISVVSLRKTSGTRLRQV